MPESQNIEYKSSWRDEYLKWICGFANAQGGKLYIGVSDDGQVCGVLNAKRLMEDIPNKIRESLGMLVDVNLLSADSKEYIEISVPASSEPINYRGEYHYRSGSTKQLLQGPALAHFFWTGPGQNGMLCLLMVLNLGIWTRKASTFFVVRQRNPAE
ncbi:helix-turn-helix domain-containing protein [Fibrobacter sp. UWR3]|uniref:AlbA family DNA-binding domain-containing protein n=1 Tax=Fibrobacter sp. UWR3 TaxID=1896217 RepID=UPI000ADCE663|nr:ATP-binding protein [Fibrobacter sp. UWR3]